MSIPLGLGSILQIVVYRNTLGLRPSAHWNETSTLSTLRRSISLRKPLIFEPKESSTEIGKHCIPPFLLSRVIAELLNTRLALPSGVGFGGVTQ
jgi:hypothetical protein